MAAEDWIGGEDPDAEGDQALFDYQNRQDSARKIANQKGESMALRIIRASDPITVKNLTIVVYGAPGIGKTSLAFTAADVLLLDCDSGAYRSRNRGDSVPVEGWRDIASITPEDLTKYKTIVLDTAGRALDALTIDIITADPKQGRSGSLTLPGWGVLKSRFYGWLRMVRSLGIDIVLICHSNEEHKGDELIERLDIQGSSKNEIYKGADVMGRLYIYNGKRMLNFSPTDTSFGKNPAQMPPLEVPDFAKDPNFLGKVIADVKASLNKLTVQQTAAVATLDTWKAKVDAAKTMTDFDALIPESEKVPEAQRKSAKNMIIKAAKARGYAFEKTTGKFDLAAP